VCAARRAASSRAEEPPRGVTIGAGTPRGGTGASTTTTCGAVVIDSGLAVAGR
jgi:hypothetical protein